MKKAYVTLRKGWAEKSEEQIYDWSAPIGALVFGASPIKPSACRLCLYTYAPGRNAEDECRSNAAMLGIDDEVENISFNGLNGYWTCSYYCGGAVMKAWVYMEVEDYIVCIISEGTEKQCIDNLKWMERHMCFGEEVENNNGNPMSGGIPLVPPAMLWQEVDFTQRDFEMSANVVKGLSDHFNFIVKASMAPAADAAQLVERVNQDYSRHYGYREIDYDLLSDEAKSKICGISDIYIGIGKSELNPFGCLSTSILIGGVQPEPYVTSVPQEDLFKYLSDEIINNIF